MENSDSVRCYVRYLRARDRVNKAMLKHSLAKRMRKENRMRAGGSAGPCSSLTSTRGQKKNLVCFEETTDKCVSQPKAQCKGESANTCPAQTTPMQNQCQLKRDCENRCSCQCKESCQFSPTTKCQCKKPQKSSHCCQCNEPAVKLCKCNEPAVRSCQCNDKASQTPCVMCECKKEPKRSSCQCKETDEEIEITSKSSKKELKEEKKKRKKDEKREKKVEKTKNSDKSKRAKKQKENSDNDDACSCCSCEEETAEKSNKKKKSKSRSATPNSSGSSRRRWSCSGRSSKNSASNKEKQRQQLSANSKKKTEACPCSSCEEPKQCDCCSCQSATCSCQEPPSCCCEKSPVCQQEENATCGSCIQKPCTDCSKISEMSQQICEMQKRWELKAKENKEDYEHHSELLKDICSKFSDLSSTVKTLTKQCKEQSKMCSATVPPPPLQAKSEPCLKKVSSTCQYCCDKNLPVLNDLKCKLLDVIGKRQFDDVVLTILLRSDNVYHVNIKDLNNGSVLGCLLVNDAAIKDANKFGLFKQVLTFFMIDVRNTLKPCESVFGITFEYVKEKRQCGGSLSTDCQGDDDLSEQRRNIVAEIFGLPLKNLSDVYCTTHACKVASVRARFFDHHLESSLCNYDSHCQPHEYTRTSLSLNLKKCQPLERIVPSKCDSFINRIETLFKFSECDSNFVLTDCDLGYAIQEIEVTSLSDITLQSSI